jgi:hypothetical protein
MANTLNWLGGNLKMNGVNLPEIEIVAPVKRP